jgi:lysophospholipase L1-like esterase
MATFVGTICLLAAAPIASSAGAAARPLYAALGDSTAVGYGAAHGSYVARLHARLRGRWPALALSNLAENGATSDDVLRRQLPALRGLRPTLVTVGVGVNDLTRQIPAEHVVAHLARIAEGVRELGATLVLINVPDVSLAPAVPSYLREPIRLRVEQINAAIAKLARERGLDVVDLFAHSQREVPGHPELFGPDGFHPSDAGQAAWAEAMAPIVERALARSGAAPSPPRDEPSR